jgi:hypothetical protein
MKRTMLVIPTADAPESTSEVFIMGASEAKEHSLIANAQFRSSMAVLNDISLVIDSQNIANQTLAEMWVPDENRPSCNLCKRKFHFAYRRRHHCRLCGDVVCKSCYVTRNVPQAEMVRTDSANTEICQTKFCVRCVMGLRAIDKQLDEFSQQLSKVMSVDFDALSMTAESFDEGSEEFFVIQSPVSNNRRASSSFLFSKRGANRVDLHASLPPGHYGEESRHGYDQEDHHSKTLEGVGVGGIGSFSSNGFGSSTSRRTSFSENPAQPSSYSNLHGQSGLDRYNSASSLGSQPDVLEEKVILHYDGLSRIVAI